jgi:uncharacterized protein with HEPN domain
MSRDESLYLADIQESCEKVIRFTRGMTYKQFVHDDLHFDAVLRNLEIIGEAVKNISEEKRQKYSQIKWRKIAVTLLRMDILGLTMKQCGIL